MKVIIRNIRPEYWPAAVKAALAWQQWHNKEGQQKHKTIMDGRFVVHETATGTIVVTAKEHV